MAKRQPTVLRMPENGAGDPFFGRQGNWFEVIFESSYDGIYIADGNAITLTLNKSYETISGLHKEEMVGRSMAELVESRVISASGTLLALERRESVTMEQLFKTGKRAIITSTPVFDAESNIVMVVTNVRDVTELYSLKEQLEQSEERNRLYSAELEAARNRQDRSPSSLIFHEECHQFAEPCRPNGGAGAAAGRGRRGQGRPFGVYLCQKQAPQGKLHYSAVRLAA